MADNGEQELANIKSTLVQYKVITNTYIAMYNQQLKLLRDANNIIKRLFFVSAGFALLWVITLGLYLYNKH